MSPRNTPPEAEPIDWLLWSLCGGGLMAFFLFIGWAFNWGGLQ